MDTLTKDQQVNFWDNKAQTFPRYEDKENNYESGMLDRIKRMGVVFKDADVLDVGCGSGMYTIRIAREAKTVTGTDISGEMLRIMSEDAKAYCVNNITTVHTDWAGFTPERKYDVVFCSMTPAIQSDEARRKVTDCSLKSAAYMGFAGKMDSAVLNGLYGKFGIEQRDFSDSYKMKEWLDRNKYAYSAEVVDGEWVVVRTLDEMAKNAYDMLSTYNVPLDAQYIREYVEQFRNGKGEYIDRTKYRIEVIVWHV
ncbi:class I SAM-dependent methyltransferase [Seleniivibrio woodruffii]|uniref:class I SAM-dependent methyltransferase n=1 Tax=Seleniivibrio woodruffii TaxID=1078050 RepID=UPI0026F21F20|nr:class I SAM-dependent methyltransferase [Seleniivibrio woodruffii]